MSCSGPPDENPTALQPVFCAERSADMVSAVRPETLVATTSEPGPVVYGSRYPFTTSTWTGERESSE